MATLQGIADTARNLLRDFPKFFEETYSPIRASTVRLGHPYLASIEVHDVATGTEFNEYTIDWRNGTLKLHNPEQHAAGIYVLGYHYEWFLDDDLIFYANMVVEEHLYDRSETDELSQISGAEEHVIAVGALTYALWSLVTEFSTQIDVSTPEGMMIPAHMRFQQVSSLFASWKAKYDELSAATNTGLNKISVKELRRRAHLTNRLVPIFREREIDDPRPPQRVILPVDEIGPTAEEGGAQSGSMMSEYGIGGSGWETIGTSGG